MKPILFNTEMVRAILDGRKMVTRRVAFEASDLRPFPRKNDPDSWWFSGRAYRNWYDAMHSLQAVLGCCKYRPGDILYVRETFTVENGKYYYRADFESDYLDPCETLSGGYPSRCSYYPGCIGCCAEPTRIHWKPSIHMPKKAARLFLRVTDVRVERLQDTNGHDVLAEGVDNGSSNPTMGARWENMQRMAFESLWDSTIKKADLPLYGWAANPWVWVIEFERISKEKAYHGKT